jgi:ATP-binding cassette, subfamily G (WHITE), eye pigment precursor transporter
MTCIGGLAKNGRTVVASIHQPRSSIYALFDQLYLISEGRTMFAGDAIKAVEYFASIDKKFECPALFNPADW